MQGDCWKSWDGMLWNISMKKFYVYLMHYNKIKLTLYLKCCFKLLYVVHRIYLSIFSIFMGSKSSCWFFDQESCLFKKWPYLTRWPFGGLYLDYDSMGFSLPGLLCASPCAAPICWTNANWIYAICIILYKNGTCHTNKMFDKEFLGCLIKIVLKNF